MPHHTDSSPTTRTAIVLLGGDPVAPGSAPEVGAVERGGLVIAADSGVDQAHRLGLVVDLAVGDFDSVSARGLARAADEGAVVEHHPAEKDETDLELALSAALVRGVTDVVVVGGHGGRLDHLLANALVLAAPRWRSMRVRAVGPLDARLHVVHDEVALAGSPGELVSVLPVHGPADGVRTRGLRYPLHGERLEPGTSRGVSNELVATEGGVSVVSGSLLVVLPGIRSEPPNPTIER